MSKSFKFNIGDRKSWPSKIEIEYLGSIDFSSVEEEKTKLELLRNAYYNCQKTNIQEAADNAWTELNQYYNKLKELSSVYWYLEDWLLMARLKEVLLEFRKKTFKMDKYDEIISLRDILDAYCWHYRWPDSNKENINVENGLTTVEKRDLIFKSYSAIENYVNSGYYNPDETVYAKCKIIQLFSDTSESCRDDYIIVKKMYSEFFLTRICLGNSFVKNRTRESVKETEYLSVNEVLESDDYLFCSDSILDTIIDWFYFTIDVDWVKTVDPGKISQLVVATNDRYNYFKKYGDLIGSIFGGSYTTIFCERFEDLSNKLIEFGMK